MRKRTLRKLRNITLKTVAWIMAALFLLSGMALDSASWLPYIVLCVSGGYLTLMAYANGLLGRRCL